MPALVKVLFWVADCWLLPVSSHGGRGAQRGLFYKSTNLTYEDSTLCPHHFPKVSPPNTIALSIVFYYVSFGGPKHSDHSSNILNLSQRLET